MGDPKAKLRKKYKTPSHPWQKLRIEEERILSREYGTKNKKELWKMYSKLRNFTSQSKKLIALKTQQAEKEKKQLMEKIQRLGLLKKTAQSTDILGLTIKDVMERRLQTLVHRKGLARTTKQARQFITHEHITIGDRVITSPSYLVSVGEEPKISFKGTSKLASTDHPERTVEKQKKTIKKQLTRKTRARR